MNTKNREGDIFEMTQSDMRIAIAEALGWQCWEGLSGQYHLLPPNEDRVPDYWRKCQRPSGAFAGVAPNWPIDLIAAMRLHKSAQNDPSFWARYLFALRDVMTYKFVGPASCWMALLEFFDADTICRAWLIAKQA